MQEAARDAAGRTFYVGDTVGGTTLKTVTIVGEVVDIEPALVRVRLETDGVPAVRGGPAPLKGAEVAVNTQRVFLVRRAAKGRQVLFTGTVDETLQHADRQRAAWLLVRAANGCDCTDPEPDPCGSACYPAPRGSQCSCHHIHNREELLALLEGMRALNPLVDDLDEHRRHMAEVYNESGCHDSEAQRWAREFLAHHARSLAAALHAVLPYVREDAGHTFGRGFTGAIDYLRTYAYGLDPEGNGSK